MTIKFGKTKPIFKYLLERHADLEPLNSRILYIRPLRHLLLKIFIDRSSDADYISLQWNIVELFWPNRKLDLVVGHRNHLSRSSYSEKRYWQWSDPTMVGDAIFALESEALPLMRSMQHFETYAAYYYFLNKRSNFEYDESRLVLDIAMGNLDSAEKLCRELLPKYKVDLYPDLPRWQALRNKVITVAEPLFARDIGALAKILCNWEYTNIRGTAFESHWEATPFPLERQTA